MSHSFDSKSQPTTGATAQRGPFLDTLRGWHGKLERFDADLTPISPFNDGGERASNDERFDDRENIVEKTEHRTEDERPSLIARLKAVVADVRSAMRRERYRRIGLRRLDGLSPAVRADLGIDPGQVPVILARSTRHAEDAHKRAGEG
jgi:hypothetical protein